MTKRMVGLCALSAVVLGFVAAGPVLSQDSVSDQKLAMSMDEFMAMSQPGEHHEWLKKSVGEWDVTMKSWWGGPGTEPMVSKGTSKVESVLNGRFIKEDFRAKMMMPGADGQMQQFDMQGISLMGYDNYQNMYVGSWCDNMATSFTTMRGSRKPGSDKLVTYCEMDEPMLGVRGRMVRMVSELVDKNTHVMRMYDLHAGEDYMVMEFVYKRR